MAEIFVGLMSGTSMDGVDGVLLNFSGDQFTVVGHATQGFPDDLRAELLALNRPGPDELHRAALATNGLVRIYAQVVGLLLAKSGLKSAEITAIGAHGQTVRHCPDQGYTLQLNNPALLAELTGIPVIADFRSRDVAAGGQGAPLAPLFHSAVFAKPDAPVAILNLGGISNLTALGAQGHTNRLIGFDCGPGNALMDYWCQRHTGADYDDKGAWAATGRVDDALLADMLSDAYFDLAPPKSTGRDLFNPDWLEVHLARHPGVGSRVDDVQASLCELTAQSCANAILSQAGNAVDVLVCGGGAFNAFLMQRLQSLLPAHRIQTTSARGLPPMQVEAAAFAWLASKTWHREKLPLQSTTGAKGSRVLGCIYPA